MSDVDQMSDMFAERPPEPAPQSPEPPPVEVAVEEPVAVVQAPQAAAEQAPVPEAPPKPARAANVGVESRGETISLFGAEHDESQTAPREFPAFDERIPVEFCCPRCRYAWSGAPKPTEDEVEGDFQ